MTLADAALAAAATNTATEPSNFPPETVAIFAGVFALSLIVDLVQHKDHKPITVSNAAGWSLVWISLAMGFAWWLKSHHGVDHPEWSSLFLTGYVLEKTLSVDNLMVFIAIFRYFRIESGLQHRILYFGILGAIVFRAVFVALGSGLLEWAGVWAELGFGLFVLWAAIKMLGSGGDDDGEVDYGTMPLVRFFRRFYPVFPRLVGNRFFIDRPTAEREAAQAGGVTLDPKASRWMTPAFICLLAVEGSDVMFSVDSVPAVIAVTKSPLIVYTAMIFAVLGLRSLYFIIEALIEKLSRLESAVVFVLAFIGIKMLVNASGHWGFHVPWWSDLDTPTQASYSLWVVLSLLAAGVLASLVWPKPDEESAGAE